MSQERRVILLIFNNFANLFLCINASTDFILYCFLSEKFARTCKQLIFRQCVNEKNTSRSRSRFLSFDHPSFIVSSSSYNFQQQKLAARTTNKYYLQLYEFYHYSSHFKTNRSKKWGKKYSHSIVTSEKVDSPIFYQRPSLERNQTQQQTKSLGISVNTRSSSSSDYIHENGINNEANVSINTLILHTHEASVEASVSTM